MELTSSAFEHQGVIPERYTCDGSDVSPPLTLRDVPSAAVTLVLVMEDPDAPGGVWDHWIAFDIPAETSIPEAVTSLGTPGRNSSGRAEYEGPCPPSGIHRYFISVYALDTRLGLEPGADKAEVLEALSGHVLAEATLMGRYGRGRKRRFLRAGR
jgi:Raf kinase inhibitor-like YbhB/YbcL family protein